MAPSIEISSNMALDATASAVWVLDAELEMVAASQIH
jgi:hypothetical protein